MKALGYVGVLWLTCLVAAAFLGAIDAPDCPGLLSPAQRAEIINRQGI